MFRLPFISRATIRLLFFFLILALILSSCGRNNETDEAGQSTTRLEVVVFATSTPGPPTPAPPTNTPFPTAKPTDPIPTFTPLVTLTIEADQSAEAQTPAILPATPASNLTRAEAENPLTGLIVDDPIMLKRRPLHVRIGNDLQARPQINLSQADIVYEEIVEWWITRLTAVYYGQAPEVVAPVRSARLINGQLTQQYNAALINSGGSDGVRWELSQLSFINLDEYFHPQIYFYREGEPWQRRLAVNIAEAHNYLAAQNLQTTAPLRGFVFDPTPVNGSPAESIYINYPSADSKVLWRFNATTGEYERYVAGQPALDAATDEILSVPNVIIYFAEHRETNIIEDSTGATSVRIEANGEGEVWIFRDRTRLTGRWRTDGFQTPEFIDQAGQPLPLRPGRSWIQIVPTDYDILINEVPAGFGS